MDTVKNQSVSSKDEFEKIIRGLSLAIKANVQKFNPQKNGIEPEDLVQEIQIKLWKIYKSEKKIKHYSSYIKKIVNSIVIDQIRASRRYERTIDLEKEKILQDQGSGGFSRRGKKDVSKAVTLLSDSRRDVVRLFLMGLDIQEISAVLHKTEAGTRNLLYRGLDDLKDILRSQGAQSDE